MNSLMSVLKSFRLTKAADLEIEELAKNDSFHAYVPHSYFPPIQWTLSHPLCEGFSYIEEGVTSYFSVNEFDAAYPPRKPPRKAGIACKILYRDRLPDVYTFFQEGYSSVYGFFDSSFPAWPRRTTLGPSDYLSDPGNRATNSSPILIFDAMVELGMLTSIALERGLRDFLTELATTGIRHLRYKLHPGQYEESRAAVHSAFDSFGANLDLEELGASVSLEKVFSEEECKVYVFNSAAGLYAAQTGLKVFTINAFVSRYDPGYASKIDQLPAIYHQFVKPAPASQVQPVES